MDEKNKRNMENEKPSPAAMGLLYLFVGLLIFGVCMIVLSIKDGEKPRRLLRGFSPLFN